MIVEFDFFVVDDVIFGWEDCEEVFSLEWKLNFWVDFE